MSTMTPTLPTERMFVRKKWTVFACAIFTLVETIACTYIMSNLMYSYYDNYYRYSYDTERIVWISAGIIGCVAQLVGLIGAAKANFGIMMAYAFLCSGLAGVYIYVGCNVGGGTWVSFVFYMLVSILAYSFARDIRRRRTALLTNYTINQSQPQSTQIYLPNQPTYPPGQVNQGYVSAQYSAPYPAQMQVPPQNAYVNPGFSSGQGYVPQQLYTTQQYQPQQPYQPQQQPQLQTQPQPQPQNQPQFQPQSQYPSYGNDHNRLYAQPSASAPPAQPPPYSAGPESGAPSGSASPPHHPENTSWNMGKF